MGPRNLQTKRITAIWRDQLGDLSPLSTVRPSIRKRKAKANLRVHCDNVKPDIVKVGGHGDKAL